MQQETFHELAIITHSFFNITQATLGIIVKRQNNRATESLYTLLADANSVIQSTRRAHTEAENLRILAESNLRLLRTSVEVERGRIDRIINTTWPGEPKNHPRESARKAEPFIGL